MTTYLWMYMYMSNIKGLKHAMFRTDFSFVLFQKVVIRQDGLFVQETCLQFLEEHLVPNYKFEKPRDLILMFYLLGYNRPSSLASVCYIFNECISGQLMSSVARGSKHLHLIGLKCQTHQLLTVEANWPSLLCIGMT